jgi:predicted Zn-dependent protease
MTMGATMTSLERTASLTSSLRLRWLPLIIVVILFTIQYDPQKLKEIATHEMGHALGLGHANFDSDLMSERLNSDETMNISQCDVNGVLQANQWKFVNNDNIPNNPVQDEVSC